MNIVLDFCNIHLLQYMSYITSHSSQMSVSNDLNLKLLKLQSCVLLKSTFSLVTVKVSDHILLRYVFSPVVIWVTYSTYKTFRVICFPEYIVVFFLHLPHGPLVWRVHKRTVLYTDRYKQFKTIKNIQLHIKCLKALCLKLQREEHDWVDESKVL